MSNPPLILNKNLVVLARVLERLENSAVAVDAEQYRSVVNHLASELAASPHDAGLETVLRACPSVALVFENLHYHQEGLCRSPADAAINALLQARDAIALARLT
ncbi:MAG: hypothetical protein HYX47_03420 [Burkholderiales bacterium]|nr:hypothetical protein [Burkholderiales bacterium]